MNYEQTAWLLWRQTIKCCRRVSCHTHFLNMVCGSMCECDHMSFLSKVENTYFCSYSKKFREIYAQNIFLHFFFFFQFYLIVYFSNCSLLRFVLIEQKISFTLMFIMHEFCTGNIFSCCFSFFVDLCYVHVKKHWLKSI